MADQLQLRGGTTNEHSTFTGALREVTVDTDKDTLIVHDAATAGGHPLLREDGSNSALSLGTAGTPSLKFTGDANTGIYSPGADQVAISTGGTQRLLIDSTGTLSANSDVAVPNTKAYMVRDSGGTSRYAMYMSGSLSPSAGNDLFVGNTLNNNLIFYTNGTERVRVTNDGKLGVGTSSPIFTADILSGTANTGANANNPSQLSVTGPNKTLTGGGATVFVNSNSDLAVDTGGSIAFSGRNTTSSTNSVVWGVIKGAKENATSTNSAGYLAFATANHSAGSSVEALRIDSSGRVGIGTTSPVRSLQVGAHGSGNGEIALASSTTGNNSILFGDGASDPNFYKGYLQYQHLNDVLVVKTESGIQFLDSTGERARIDSSGRLLVGTSISDTQRTASMQIASAGGQSGWGSSAILSEFGTSYNPWIALQRSRNSTIGSHTVVNSGDILGGIQFNGSDGNSFEAGASIKCEVDGSAGDGDMPGRLVFSTTADAANIPTERMRIDSSGRVGIGTTSPSFRLHSYDTAAAQGFFNGWSSGGALDAAGAIRFGNQTGYQGRVDYDPTGNTNFIFENTYSNGSISWKINNTERARIDNLGRLGLGTSSPSFPLHLVTSGNSGAAVYAGTSSANQIYLGNTAGESVVGTLSNHNFGIIANGGQKVTVTTGGNVGIGTTSPGETLDVFGKIRSDSASDSRFLLRVDSTNKGGFSATTDAGVTIYGASTTNPIRFQVSGSEKAQIDTSGRLLVGTSTSTSVAGFGETKIQSRGNYESSITVVNTENNANTCGLILAKVRSTSIVQNGDPLGGIYYQGYDGSAHKIGASILAYVDGTPGTNDMPGRLVFSTTADGASSPTERMRIENTGVMRHLSNSPSGGSGYVVLHTQSAGTSTSLIQGVHSATTVLNGTVCFKVATNGNVENTNNSYGAYSDIKLKENIVDASSQWDDLKAIQVRNYNFKPETGAETFKQIGLIAQEVELVSPGLVSESPDRDGEGNDLGTVTKSVNYSVLYMKAVKALQEAMERIETLEAKVAALEAQ